MKVMHNIGIRAVLAAYLLLLVGVIVLVSSTWAGKPDKPGMHVESISVSLTPSAGNLWEATAKVEVLDKNNAPVEGATVTGDWDLGGTVFNSGASEITGQDGSVQILSGQQAANNEDTFTFTVTNVKLRGFTYDRSANVETFDSATVTTGPTPLSVVNISPADGAANVAITTTVQVTFSEAVDPLTIDENSFRISTGGNPVAGTRALSAEDTVATFTPDEDLSFQTTYVVSLTNGITDTSGNALDPEFNSAFTTEDDTQTLLDDRYRFADNNSYYPDIRTFTQARTLYVQVRSDMIDYNRLRKSEVNLSPWGEKFPLSHNTSGSQQGTYTGSRTLSDIPAGETTVNITLTDRARNRFTASTTITIEIIADDEVSYPFQGIRWTRRTVNTPRPLNMNILEVTLAAVSFFVSPGNPNPSPDSCTEAVTSKTSTFVETFDLQVGINGDFSDANCGSTPSSEGQPANVAGLGVSYRSSTSGRDQYSSHDDRPALGFDLSNQAYIGWYPGNQPFPDQVYNAVGGNKMLVVGGQPVNPDTWDPLGGALQLHPRTGVGLSDDGLTLIIIVIDGRYPGFSEGVTLPEMAGYLIEFGAHTALNLDGGGSSTMVFNTPETLTEVINNPSDGAERVRPNHLGIYAAPTSAPLVLSQIRLVEDVPAAGLWQNYPNPFNPETWIPFTLSSNARVVIKIHSMTGQLVKSLELGEMAPGAYLGRDRAAYWDGRNEVGEQVSSGIYFYSIQAGSFFATRKMIATE